MEKETFVVRCIERCWDSKKCRLYYPGDQDEVNPMDPIAKYFEGWPPGTEVYTKSKGISGTRIVPGKIKKAEEEVKPDGGSGVGSSDIKPLKKAKGKKVT